MLQTRKICAERCTTRRAIDSRDELYREAHRARSYHFHKKQTCLQTTYKYQASTSVVCSSDRNVSRETAS